MITLGEAFRRVVGALDRVDAEYVVVGSTAAAAWGVVRSTRDIDLVTVVSAMSPDSLLEGLSDEELYVPVQDAKRALTQGGSFNVLHPGSGGKVDVFVCLPDDEFERQRLLRRVPVEMFGVQTWVATAEDVVLSKLRWRKESRSEIQWRDCVELAAIQQLDLDYLHEWAPRLGLSADLEALLHESEAGDTA